MDYKFENLISEAQVEDEVALIELEEVFPRFLERAKNGVAEDQFKIAYIFFNLEAFLYKWKKKGDPSYHIGDFQINETIAAELYLLAAKQGHVKAQFELSECFANGTGVPEDDDVCIHWCKKAAEGGHRLAQEFLGMAYSLGYFGVDLDLNKSAKWYKKAAKQGLPQAQIQIGRYYEGGVGVDRDLKEAAKWYKKAAEQKNDYIVMGGNRGDAQFILGRYYYWGHGLKENKKEALKWFKKAICTKENGYGLQQSGMPELYIAQCYQWGEGIKKCNNEALKWYQIAAEKGQPDAQYHLGRFYHKGDLVTKNLKEAVKWLKKSADQDTAGAQWFLGTCYESGDGVTKNLKKAFNLYKMAAEQDHEQAQVMVGRCYENGNGVTKHLVNAYAWYNVACANGNDNACEYRDSLESTLTKTQLHKAQNLSQDFYEIIQRRS